MFRSSRTLTCRVTKFTYKTGHQTILINSPWPRRNPESKQAHRLASSPHQSTSQLTSQLALQLTHQSKSQLTSQLTPQLTHHIKQTHILPKTIANLVTVKSNLIQKTLSLTCQFYNRLPKDGLMTSGTKNQGKKKIQVNLWFYWLLCRREARRVCLRATSYNIGQISEIGLQLISLRPAITGIKRTVIRPETSQ